MNKGEIILKFGEGHTSELDTYHSYWLRKALQVSENFWLIHESDTGYWGLFTNITELFLGNGSFWNI